MLHARLPRTEGAVRLGFVLADGRTSIAALRQSGAASARFPRSTIGDFPEAVLLNTAGGLTGGDRIDIEVAVAAGCNATITSAAAEKVYRALDGEAEVHVRLDVGEGARLAWLPQPTIMFDRARLHRRTEVAISGSSSFLAVERLIFGRSAMGEDVHRGACRDSWRVRR
ncbi:MAG: urease accessory protein UreD, partial [Hyphomicrobiaceae bacterium]|nr:urease accessory protein UreD [Hyphomicrobiaceae bacterium]